MIYDISEQYDNDIITFNFQYSFWFGLWQMLSFAQENHTLFAFLLVIVNPTIFD